MTVADLEALLTDAYAEEAILYGHILEGVDRLAPGSEPAAVDAWLLQLSRQLEAVYAIDARLQPVKAAWQHTGRRPGAQLSAILAEVAQAIGKLQGRMEQTMADLQVQQRQPAHAANKEHEPRITRMARIEKMRGVRS